MKTKSKPEVYYDKSLRSINIRVVHTYPGNYEKSWIVFIEPKDLLRVIWKLIKIKLTRMFSYET